MICTHRINPACGIPRFLSRFARRAGLVHLRQRFVHRCHGRKKAPGTKTFDLDQTFEPGSRNRRPTTDVGGAEDARSIMSDEFDSLDATEKAAIRATLIRCRALAAKIANELRNKKPEQFVDKLSLADLYASLEHAARVLEQKKR